MRRQQTSFKVLAIGLALGWAGTARAMPTPAQRCHATKLTAAATFGLCRLKAEAKAVKTGKPPNYGKCGAKLEKKFTAAETKAGAGECPTQGDATVVEELITGDSTTVAGVLNGTVAVGCGDGTKGGSEACDGSDLGGQTCLGLGFPGGTLACTPFCSFDVSACHGNFPASGQTIPSTTGDDGDVRARAPLSYVDNGDGTITDGNTGLMWEKKCDDGGSHDKDNTYMWTPGSGSIWEWIGVINSEGVSGFAGHSDWRIPNVKELHSIVNYGRVAPTVHPAFNTACLPGCTVTTCSCTAAYAAEGTSYWSSTSSLVNPEFAWNVYFVVGDVHALHKSIALNVRAVRGGL